MKPSELICLKLKLYWYSTKIVTSAWKQRKNELLLHVVIL